MKKVLCLLLIIALFATLCGCAETEVYETTGESSETETSESSETEVSETNETESSETESESAITAKFNGLIDVNLSPAGKSFIYAEHPSNNSSNYLSFDSEGKYTFVDFLGDSSAEGKWIQNSDATVLVNGKSQSDTKNVTCNFICYKDYIISYEKQDATLKKNKVQYYSGQLSKSSETGYSGKLFYYLNEGTSSSWMQFNNDGTLKTSFDTPYIKYIYNIVDEHIISYVMINVNGEIAERYYIFIADNGTAFPAYKQKYN